MLSETTTATTSLKLGKHGAGVGLNVLIQNGELRHVKLAVDKHKNSSLPAEWESVEIHGGLNDLKILRDFCEEMIAEIEKRLKE